MGMLQGGQDGYGGQGDDWKKHKGTYQNMDVGDIDTMGGAGGHNKIDNVVFGSIGNL